MILALFSGHQNVALYCYNISYMLGTETYNECHDRDRTHKLRSVDL